MKKTIYAFFALMIVAGIAVQAFAADKTTTQIQTDLENYKLREFNAQVMYDRLIDITDSFYNPNDVGEVVTEANVIASTECGEVFFLSAVSEFASTLPSPALGCSLEFVVSAAPSGASYTIVTTGAETIKGLGFESETDSTEDGPTTSGADTITLVDGVAVAGDRVNLVSDGVSWFAKGFTAADGGITYTSAI